ncbi:MAG TPA: lipopolysaccharide heptosyltransferase II [Casimicrobiaceae bacterium]|nr:lipopolysaccharide heptosyltransferase II [Casimicrobiaceae bacterium]
MPVLQHAISAGRRRTTASSPLTQERILVVAPSWVGDAILSEPLIALVREPYEAPVIDVLAPPWCAPVYARMRGVREIIESPMAHGRIALRRRRELGRRLSSAHYTRAIVLPNSWKSALVPWLARIPKRTGYRGEFRYGLLNDLRWLDRKVRPRLVDRFAALAMSPGALVPLPPAPVLVPNAANRNEAMRAMHLRVDRPIAALCPGAEFGPSKRWPPTHFADLAARLLADGMQVWLVGSPNDKLAASSVLQAAGEPGRLIFDLTGRTDLGTAIDLLSIANIVVSNDSGLMHAAAAVGAPVVALFGSSSPLYTPPLSPLAQVAKIDIACSPCFKRECPLGHQKCMRELKATAVYDLARFAVREE